MEKWTRELPLQFIYIGSHQIANLTIGFFSASYHTVWHQGKIKNCTFPFQSNTLAHAHGFHHSPSVRGQIHFNGLYRWNLYNNGTTDKSIPIFHVSLHEMGHILKLADNDEKNTVMYKVLIPIHNHITDIDKARAQIIWGRSTNKIKQIKINNTTKTASTKYNSFNMIMFSVIMIILLLVIIVLATFSIINKNNEHCDSPESFNLMFNNS